LSAQEARIVRRIRRAKLFIWLREHRHELFDAALQADLACLYKESAHGQPPIPPAQLALALILQAYTGVSDDEVIEATQMDRRWQLVLDCLDGDDAPFSKGTLVGFRRAVIAHELDRRLIEQTVTLAQRRGGLSPRHLRAALDSSPLWGAGRVEDTCNLLGHALRKALGVIARQQGRGLAELAAAAGVGVVAGSSLKATLDLDWDDPAAQAAALTTLLAALETLAGWADEQRPLVPPSALREPLAAAQQIVAQDVVLAEAAPPALRRGVAAERRISIEDAEMRHGRKSRSLLVDGYKRHVLHDLDLGVVRAAGVTPANAPEATVTASIAADLAHQSAVLGELHIDRAYLSSALVRERPPALAIYCKAWPVRRGPHFAKTAFTLDWDTHTLTCPNAVRLPFTPGGTVQFPADICAACPLRARCTTSRHGRSVAIHPDERLLQELRARQQTPLGRAQLRERVAVEHTLAHVGQWQGDRARYVGQRKNLFDLRRVAVVHNLHVLQRQPIVEPVAA
jgi:transposase